MWTLAGLHADLAHRFAISTFSDSVGPQDLVVDVLAGQIGIGLEHIGREAAPHHQFDHTFGNVLFNQVRDS